MADSTNETPSRRWRRDDGYLPPPPPRRQVHSGYYSDDEGFARPRTKLPFIGSAESRVPSPPGALGREAPVSYAPRVPSPPRRYTTYFDSTETTVSQSAPRGHRRHRDGSDRGSRSPRRAKPAMSPTIVVPTTFRPVTIEARVPSPPPSSARRMSFGGNSGRPAGLSMHSDSRFETRYLSPLDGVEAGSSSRRGGAGGGGIDGVRRSNSDRGPRPHMRSSASRAAAEVVVQDQPAASAPKKPPPASLSPSSTTNLTTSSQGILGDQAYQYRPLGESQFRLVRIRPLRKTRVQCEIIHASLQNPPRYVAISYAWGDAGVTTKIELEGSLIPISVSLHGALDALRSKTESVMVWADALCIDQQNKEERTLQVRLMTNIYSMADSVAVWLGPEADGSVAATELLCTIAERASSPERLSRLIASQAEKRDLDAVVSLFDRDYWKRLWVVQEIFNARSITVYCGRTRLPWDVYQTASNVFLRHRADLDRYFHESQQQDRRRSTIAMSQFSYAQVLVYQGPGDLPDLGHLRMDRGGGGANNTGNHDAAAAAARNNNNEEDTALLEVLRDCRSKLASDPRDKLFGILGVLPEEVRRDFRADYSQSVKDVYAEIVDYLVQTTGSLDIICYAIHFPLHSSSLSLPSFVPDWSHIPQTTALCHKFDFKAARGTTADCRFDERLNKLEITAICLDTISIHGMAVGTLCKLGDYLMAFLHWRAMLLGELEGKSEDFKMAMQEEFCRTLSLGQVPPGYKLRQWMNACYRVFATLLRERLPYMPLPRDLNQYLDRTILDCGPEPDNPRKFLQTHFGDRMMGRCFCYTKAGRIGMGTGFMMPGDLVVVPLGCSTPVLLRPEGMRGEYRFVGDAYIYGYMYGRAVEHWKQGKWDLRKFVLH